jgi:hypothetical protein
VVTQLVEALRYKSEDCRFENLKVSLEFFIPINKVVKMSALHTGHLYPPQEIFLILISVRG